MFSLGGNPYYRTQNRSFEKSYDVKLSTTNSYGTPSAETVLRPCSLESEGYLEIPRSLSDSGNSSCGIGAEIGALSSSFAGRFSRVSGDELRPPGGANATRSRDNVARHGL